MATLTPYEKQIIIDLLKDNVIYSYTDSMEKIPCNCSHCTTYQKLIKIIEKLP